MRSEQLNKESSLQEIVDKLNREYIENRIKKLGPKFIKDKTKVKLKDIYKEQKGNSSPLQEKKNNIKRRHNHA